MEVAILVAIVDATNDWFLSLEWKEEAEEEQNTLNNHRYDLTEWKWNYRFPFTDATKTEHTVCTTDGRALICLWV